MGDHEDRGLHVAHDREDRGERKGHKGGGRDREKKDGWKAQATENWKDGRRRRSDKVEDGKLEVLENVSGPQALPTGDLLSMLKSKTSKRYSREELLAISQLAPSRVKPPLLNSLIDSANKESPLLFRGKSDKSGRRRGDDEDEAEEENGSRRDRRKDRARRDSDDEDEASQRKGPVQPGRWDQRWKDEGSSHARYEEAEAEHTALWAQGGEAPEWDMPDVATGNQGDLADFTMGDIRQAERSLKQGMSLKDYKASLKPGSSEAATGHQAAQRGDPVAAPAQAQLEAEGSFFADDDEGEADDAGGIEQSRGFGKWFSSRPQADLEVEETIEEADEEAEEDLWDMPTRPAVNSVSSASSAPAGKLGGPALPGSVQSQPVAPGMQPVSSQQPQPAQAGLQPLRREAPSRPAAAGLVRRADPQEVLRQEESLSTTNSAGRSILSMLGRNNAGGDFAQAADPSTNGQDNKGKLSVAELFQIAKGKDVPPMPMPIPPSPQRREVEEERARQEALHSMQLMWGQGGPGPGLPHSGRYMGFQHPGMMPFGPAPGGPHGGRPMGTPGQDDLYGDPYGMAMARGFPGYGMLGPRGPGGYMGPHPPYAGFPPDYGAMAGAYPPPAQVFPPVVHTPQTPPVSSAPRPPSVPVSPMSEGRPPSMRTPTASSAAAPEVSPSPPQVPAGGPLNGPSSLATPLSGGSPHSGGGSPDHAGPSPEASGSPEDGEGSCAQS